MPHLTAKLVVDYRRQKSDEIKSVLSSTIKITERKKEKDEEDHIKWGLRRKEAKAEILADPSSGRRPNREKLITKE